MATSVTVRDVILAPGNGSFFYDDQAAIRAGVATDGFRYVGSPLTPGFETIRMPARSLSIGLVLSDGMVVWGDMMSVQYSGAGGRDPLFRTDEITSLTRSVVFPRLKSTDISNFQAACRHVLANHEGRRLPLAVEYGVSQALLAAAAHVARTTLTEVVCSEYSLPLPEKRVPLYAQSGDAREINVDKMILKAIDILPHGLINSREKFGSAGETFRAFVKWVAQRVSEIGEPGYHPTLHFDVYGWIGLEIGMDAGAIADFICAVADDVPDYRLHIESPADFGSTKAQLDEYAKIVDLLDRRGSNARIVVDEQCNTLDDIKLFAETRAAHIVQIKMPDVGSVADTITGALACKQAGVGAYVGGSCSETDLSARVSAQIAIATQADMVLAKPGMGVDEGISIVGNEQNRVLAILDYRRGQSAPSNVMASLT
ncbi:3-methylaspartate ammonia-lyase [Shinella sp. SUS2]|uniref:methylaspartate ammonia-lyase n=1 Tax=unclassified Shinella TaxID=2643062 RepID=UPI00067FAFB9|nr:MULTISPECIES: methylaspartate ammonia-lyase [unclassified Shinella]KNY13249.1 3-methylaspartate ammonia-lyase [Shinella sp. SUS2]KOC72066.1 3-methylaspartate ammonia-lyase [Shinella sp. GWS1]